jgi:hypothetical protein
MIMQLEVYIPIKTLKGTILPLYKKTCRIPYFLGGRFVWKYFFWLAHFYLMNNRPNIKCMVRTFFEDRFVI